MRFGVGLTEEPISHEHTRINPVPGATAWALASAQRWQIDPVFDAFISISAEAFGEEFKRWRRATILGTREDTGAI